MVDHFSPFEPQIDTLLRRLDDLEHRLRAVEARSGSLPLRETEIEPAAEQTAPARRFPTTRRFSPVMIAGFAGRTSLVLGGGYLLRALTDFGILPLELGVVLGVIYALLWFVMADRAGAAQANTSATFHGLAAAALAFPLLYEVIIKFRLLEAWNLASALTAVAALGIAVGWRRWLQGIVWIVSAASILTVFALLRASVDVAPVALHLVLLATLAYWVAHTRNWSRVRWPAALVADVAVIWLTLNSFPPQNPLQLTLAIAVALTLFVASVGSFTVRMLVLGQEVTRFDIFQSAAALLVGYGGAAYIARASNLSIVPYGAAALVLGVSAYAVAFGLVADRLSQKNFRYFSTFAIALVIIGGTLALRPPLATVFWIALALAGVWLGGRLGNVTLSAHGAAYLTAAAVASGLVVEAGYGLVASAARPWREITPVALLALAAAAACSAVSPVGTRTFRGSKIVATISAYRVSLAVPRAIALGILILGLAGVVVVWIVPTLAGPPGRESDWGIIATIRTAALGVAVILMGLLARGDRVREAGWLIYPLLIAAGVKILVEDFQQSEPSTLFLALVVYGSALIVGPRLAAR